MAKLISTHNNNWYKTQVDKYKIGKYQYHLTASSVVYSEEMNKYTDTRHIEFKSDFKKEDITIDIIIDGVEKFYAELDYPDFVELNFHNIISLFDAVDVKDVKLFNFGDNKNITMNIYNHPINI